VLRVLVARYEVRNWRRIIFTWKTPVEKRIVDELFFYQ